MVYPGNNQKDGQSFQPSHLAKMISDGDIYNATYLDIPRIYAYILRVSFADYMRQSATDLLLGGIFAIGGAISLSLSFNSGKTSRKSRKKE